MAESCKPMCGLLPVAIHHGLHNWEPWWHYNFNGYFQLCSLTQSSITSIRPVSGLKHRFACPKQIQALTCSPSKTHTKHITLHAKALRKRPVNPSLAKITWLVCAYLKHVQPVCISIPMRLCCDTQQNEREPPHRTPFFITLCTHTNSRDDSYQPILSLEHMTQLYANTINNFILTCVFSLSISGMQAVYFLNEPKP